MGGEWEHPRFNIKYFYKHPFGVVADVKIIYDSLTLPTGNDMQKQANNPQEYEE